MALAENDAERQNYIAIAQVQAQVAPQVAAVHAQSTYGQAYSQQQRIMAEADTQSNLISSIASVEAASSGWNAYVTAAVSSGEAYIQSLVNGVEAAQQVALIGSESGFDVAVINASLSAQVKATQSETAIQVRSASDIATVNANATSAEAAIRVNTILATGSDQQSTEVEIARLRVGGIQLAAASRANQTTVDAATQVDATGRIAATSAAESIALARIRANEIAATDVFQVQYIAGDADLSSLASRSVANAQAREVRLSSAEQVRRETAVTGINATYETDQATAEAVLRRYQSDRDRFASDYSTDGQYSELVFATDTQATASNYRSARGYASDVVVADRSLSERKNDSDGDRTGRLAQANSRSTGDRYQADRRYATTVVKESGENRRLLKQLAWNENHFALLYKRFGELTDTGFLVTPGLDLNPARVRVSGVFPPSLEQAQVNSVYAQADAESRSTFLAASGDAASRGFAPTSPFMSGVRMAADLAAVRQSSVKAAEVRVKVAAANAEAATKLQAVRGEQFTANQRAALGAESNSVRRQVGIIDGAFRVLSL